MSTHPELSRLLSSNAQWAKDVSQADPQFFSTSAQSQSPKILWIGCADSRVPESVVTASRPGDIFVHRNIANQIFADDDSVQSVLAFAINAVKVEHVIVVGHTRCGGAAACLQGANSGATAAPSTPLERWLVPLTRLAQKLDLSGKPSDVALNTLVEENVKAQVQTLAKSDPVLSAWADPTRRLHIHGWVYDLEQGTLKDLGISQNSV